MESRSIGLGSFGLRVDGTPTIRRTVEGGADLVFSVRYTWEASPTKDGAPAFTGTLSLLPATAIFREQLLGRTGAPDPHQIGARADNRVEIPLLLSSAALRGIEHGRSMPEGLDGRAARDVSITLRVPFCVQGERLATGQLDLHYRIPESDWVTMLDRADLTRSATVTIPFGPEMAPKAFDALQQHLDRAERQYRAGFYTEAVAGVRDAWDSFVASLGAKTQNDIFEACVPVPDMVARMEKLGSAIRQVVNKAHHRFEKSTPEEPFYEFTQADAEFALHCAMALFRYLGVLRAEAP